MNSKLTKSNSNINAIVTGAASGLGFATCQRIVDEGGKVTLLDINQENGQMNAEQLGENAHFVNTDVSQEASIDTAVEQAVKHFGPINLAVHCAGIAPSARVLGRDKLLSTEEFARAIQINLISSFTIARAAANSMQHNTPDAGGERGVIINTASIAAYDGQVGQAAYAASKGGIVSMTLPLAREFARFGIRVMTIAPGLFRTPLFDKLPEKAVTALEESTPFPKRLGNPAEFAEMVCAIYQNRMLNGETIRLDGALRMS